MEPGKRPACIAARRNEETRISGLEGSWVCQSYRFEGRQRRPGSEHGDSLTRSFGVTGSPASGSETGFDHLRSLERIRGMRVMHDQVCGLEEVKVFKLAPRKEEDRFD